MEIDKVEIGRRIARIRKSLGYTQAALAELAGVDDTYMSCIERGKNSVSTKVYASLSVALNTPLDYLIFGEQKSVSESIENKIRLLNVGQRKMIEYMIDGFLKGEI